MQQYRVSVERRAGEDAWRAATEKEDHLSARSGGERERVIAAFTGRSIACPLTERDFSWKRDARRDNGTIAWPSEHASQADEFLSVPTPQPLSNISFPLIRCPGAPYDDRGHFERSYERIFARTKEKGRRKVIESSEGVCFCIERLIETSFHAVVAVHRLPRDTIYNRCNLYSLFIPSFETNLIKPIHAESFKGLRGGRCAVMACDFN